MHQMIKKKKKKKKEKEKEIEHCHPVILATGKNGISPISNR